MKPLYSLADHVSAPGMTFHARVLAHVERESSATPSTLEGAAEKSTYHVPAPYQAVISCRLPSRDTPSRPGAAAPGDDDPFPPMRRTWTVHARSVRGSRSRKGCNGSGPSTGFGLKYTPSFFGFAGDAFAVPGTPGTRFSAQKWMPPITPLASVLQEVSCRPPPRSSVMTRIRPSGVTSAW